MLATDEPQPRYRRIAMIARWQPVHLGHAPVLRALCDRAGHTLIGLGSSNRYNARHPFTVDATAAMIDLVLAGRDNYTLLPVPDLDDGPRWRLMVLDLLGPLDLFVTANPYVASLMRADYALAHPVQLLPVAERVPVDGTLVRREMARGHGWRDLVPPEIARYITSHGLDERFRREFGLETLAMDLVVG